jgi:hypothetical protein
LLIITRNSGKTALLTFRKPQADAPPWKPKDNAPHGDKRAWREMRRRHSSRRIVVEHAKRQDVPVAATTAPRLHDR